MELSRRDLIASAAGIAISTAAAASTKAVSNPYPDPDKRSLARGALSASPTRDPTARWSIRSSVPTPKA